MGLARIRGPEGKLIGYAQMFDELCATGYSGTELGDWGYMPTEPDVPHAELQQRDLALTSAFVPVRLRDPSHAAAGEEHALQVARLLAATATDAAQPFLVLSDDNGASPERTAIAG